MRNLDFIAEMGNQAPVGFILIFVLVLAVIIGVAVLQHHFAKKRREAIRQVAEKLGLRFHPEKNYRAGQQLKFLDAIRGHNRYGFNIMDGQYGGFPVSALDFHYETRSTDSKGKRRTTHHYLSIFICCLPRSFAELRIHREGFLDKLVDTIGFNDIDFESAEFSRQFSVRSKDKKFAYDFVNVQMMDYLLRNTDLAIEVEGKMLCIYFKRRLDPAMLEPQLKRLVALREHMPKYLFEGT